jgi:uncharacterized protein DUF2141
MSNSVRVYPLSAIATATAALLMFVPASAAPAGPYASVCNADKPAVLARVSGLKAPTGNLLIKLYASNPKTFLEKGAFLHKVEVPVNSSGPIEICLPVPASGSYALSVRHEIRGEKSRSDGGGFSGNPRMSLMDVVFQRKPNLEKVSFVVDGATRIVPVTLLYLQGGSVRPVS